MNISYFFPLLFKDLFSSPPVHCVKRNDKRQIDQNIMNFDFKNIKFVYSS